MRPEKAHAPVFYALCVIQRSLVHQRRQFDQSTSRLDPSSFPLPRTVPALNCRNRSTSRMKSQGPLAPSHARALLPNSPQKATTQLPDVSNRTKHVPRVKEAKQKEPRTSAGGGHQFFFACSVRRSDIAAANRPNQAPLFRTESAP